MNKSLFKWMIGVFILCYSSCFSQEICDNGIDDDADGLIDLNDVIDCDCLGVGDTVVSSLIPNSSFENMDCCPQTWSELNCATDWVQASGATSDFFHTCGYVPGNMSTTGLIPLPDGDGAVGGIIAGGWQEYVGSCLLAPMQAGQGYTLEFFIAYAGGSPSAGACTSSSVYGDIDITLFGNTNCSALPFNGYDCPPAADGWMELGHVTYSPETNWGVVSISFTPNVDINTVVLGGPCQLPVAYLSADNICLPFFMYDDLNLVSSTGPITIHDTITCSSAQLSAEIDTVGGAWQWYFDGVAMVGEVSSSLDLSGASLNQGVYTAIYSLGGNCEAENFTMPYVGPDTVSYSAVSCGEYLWNNGWLTESGDYVEVLTNNFGCDSIVYLDLTIDNTSYLNVDTIVCIGMDVDYFGNSYDQSGSYSDTLTAANGCDSVLNLDLQVVDPPGLPQPYVVYSECVGGGIELHVNQPMNELAFWGGANGFVGAGGIIEIPFEEVLETYNVYMGIGGCNSASASVMVDLDKVGGVDFVIPNVITPNGDGVNDVIDLNEILKNCPFDFIVTNRWGNIVFEQSNDTSPFEGKGLNGNLLTEGDYFYKLDYNGEMKQGFIHISY